MRYKKKPNEGEQNNLQGFSVSLCDILPQNERISLKKKKKKRWIALFCVHWLVVVE